MQDDKNNLVQKEDKSVSRWYGANLSLLDKWNALTPLARNEWICWVTIVQKAETRQNHIVRLAEEILEGKKRPCCWPGYPHRRPNAGKWFKKY
jgi:hypothetical protein